MKGLGILRTQNNRKYASCGPKRPNLLSKIFY